MKPDCLLVKTAPDLYIKSDSVNQRFSQILLLNMKKALDFHGLTGFSFEIRKGRMIVHGNGLEKAMPVLSTVFGLHSVALAEFFSSTDLESVVEKTLEAAKKTIKPGDSFAVDCSRSGHHAFSSSGVERQAGALILNQISKTRVDLEKPDKTVFVNVHSNGFFVFSKTMACPNGLPVGSQGKIGFLVSGSKADAKVVWLLLRRGCRVIPIVPKKAYPAFLKKLEQWNSFEKFRIISKKEFETNSKKFELLALANSDAVVSADELEKIKKTDSEIELPIIRPLLGLDFSLLQVKR